MTIALRYAVRSDVGLLREGNEDSAYAGPHLLAVADGMGGYEAGEVASAAVISSVAPLDRKPMPESELMSALAAAVAAAKQTLRRIVESDPAVGSMGTTLTAMLWAEGSAAICHIGDSRAYLLRDDDLYQITRDHTFVQALIDQGRIRPEEAATHPQRSLLLRALDGRTDADPDLSMLSAQAGDRYLICSDGLPVAATDEQILAVLSQAAEPSDAVLQLIDLAIQGGAPDNVTCIVADVIDTAESQAAPTKAPVVAGAAANGSIDDTKTRPFSRPTFDGEVEGGATQLGTIPAGTSRNRETVPAQPRPAQPGPGQPGSVPDRPAQPRPEQAHAGQAPSTPAPSGRHAADAEGAEIVQPRRRRLPLIPSILALFVLLVTGGILVGIQYVHSQYYVGNSNGDVAIFRGLNQNLLGISLSSVYQQTPIPFSGLPSTDIQAINRGSTGSLAQAQRFVRTISTDYQACQNAYAKVRDWLAHKPKPVTKTVRENGRLVRKTVKPHYRPKPPIPAGCPPMPAH